MDLVAPYAFLVALSEFTLGAWLHAVRLPLAGHLLSWNQLFILSAGVSQTRRSIGTSSLPLQSSLVGAGVKALAPIGKRLTPMLAIATQGLLLNCGTWLLGKNPAGILVGAILFSTWSLLQPVLLSYWIFGSTWWKAMESLFEKVTEWFSLFGLGVSLSWTELLTFSLAGNAVVCVIVGQIGYVVPAQRWAKYIRWIETRSVQTAPKKNTRAMNASPWKLALRDMLRPMFLFSFALSVSFLLGLSTSHVEIAVGLCRFLILGYLTFWALRALPLARWIERRLEENRRQGRASTPVLTLLGHTLKRLQK